MDPKMPSDVTKINQLGVQAELLLQNAIQMTEVSVDLRERCTQGEKYINYLKTLASRASKNLKNLQNTSNQLLKLAQKVTSNTIATIDSTPDCEKNVQRLKANCEKLLVVIERELADTEETEFPESDAGSFSEKIKYIEAKQRLSDSSPQLRQSCSVKSVKSDVDEKYPENWSRDSLIDLNTVVNLPPVPEDIFTCFANRPQRTSSLSSLKGMRKVKLFLQRAATNSDDEDSSDLEDHEIMGDVDDRYVKKLGNIKEETQQD